LIWTLKDDEANGKTTYHQVNDGGHLLKFLNQM